MAIYENKENGKLVHSYKFTGNNEDFIKGKLISECHFADYDAECALSEFDMMTDDVIVVEHDEKGPNPEYWYIISGSTFLEFYEPFTIKG